MGRKDLSFAEGLRASATPSLPTTDHTFAEGWKARPGRDSLFIWWGPARCVAHSTNKAAIGSTVKERMPPAGWGTNARLLRRGALNLRRGVSLPNSQISLPPSVSLVSLVLVVVIFLISPGLPTNSSMYLPVLSPKWRTYIVFTTNRRDWMSINLTTVSLPKY